MNSSNLRSKVLEEIQYIPEEKLFELYEIIHKLSEKPSEASSETSSKAENAKEILDFAGCWNDLLDATFSDFVEDISVRRQQAFSGRTARETSLD